MENEKGWYVLYVPFRYEKKVYNELLEKNIDAFLPTCSTKRKSSYMKEKVETPLFSRYLFVNITSRIDFEAVLKIESPCSYVRFGNEYGRISQKEINQIRRLVKKEAVADIASNQELETVSLDNKVLSDPKVHYYSLVYSAKNCYHLNLN